MSKPEAHSVQLQIAMELLGRQLSASGPQLAASVLLAVLGLIIAVFGSSVKGRTLFAIGTVLSGSVLYSGIMPAFVDSMTPFVWPFSLLGEIVVGVGAVIGGVLTHLLIKPALGISLGFMAVVLVLFVEGGTAFAHTAASAALIGAVFVVVSVIGYLIARRDEHAATLLSMSLTGSLLLVCAWDIQAQRGVIVDLEAVLRYQWATIGSCPRGACHPELTVPAWLGIAFVSFIFQALTTGWKPAWMRNVIYRGRGSAGYTQIRQDEPGRPQLARQAISTEHMHDVSARAARVNVVDLTWVYNGETKDVDISEPEQAAVERALTFQVTLVMEALTDLFGFQMDNAFNQAEHLVLLLLNSGRYSEPTFKQLFPKSAYADVPHQGGNPADILHRRLFQNYKLWTEALGVEPIFRTNSSEPAVEHNAQTRRPSIDANGQLTYNLATPGQAGPRSSFYGDTEVNRSAKQWYNQEDTRCKLWDILLFLLIWGEAGNLRHMPECLAWLYHKLATHVLVVSTVSSSSKSNTISGRVHGYFLAETVSPIYSVVAKAMKATNLDHEFRRNYDDINEFFWHTSCLKYGWRTLEAGDDDQLGGKRPVAKPVYEGSDGTTQEPIWEALAAGPKTFLEKRSWMHILLAFQRLVDFHVVSFHCLAVLSFWELLLWDWPYGLQLLSSAFMIINVLGILWTVLEVWSAPSARVQSPVRSSPASVTVYEDMVGFLIRFSARYVILVYQALYFTRSLQDDGLSFLPDQTLNVKQTQMYYFWQYVWVSTLVVSVWVVGALVQVFPKLSTFVYTLTNDYVRALLEILFPLSRNYTGKRVHERESRVLVYATFWLTLLAWKLWFSYKFEVQPVTLPALELYDDYMNLGDQSLWVTIVLIIARWLPFIVIYLLDTTIWYAVWSGLVGLWVGMDEKLGQVRDFTHIRHHFMRTPHYFCSKLMYQADAAAADVGEPTKMPRKSQKDLQGLGEKQPLLGSSTSLTRVQNYGAEPSAVPPARVQQGYDNPSVRIAIDQASRQFLDLPTNRWVQFAKAWNAIVNHLRQTDIISNEERDMLLFHFVEDLNKPVYLPVFQTAGSVERAIKICEEKGMNFRSALNDGRVEPKKLQDHEDALWQALTSDITMHEAVLEAIELSTALLRALLVPPCQSAIGHIENSFAKVFEEAYEQADRSRTRTRPEVNEKMFILANLKLEDINKAIKPLANLVSALKTELPRRKARQRYKPVEKKAAESRVNPVNVDVGLKKSRSAGFLNSLTKLHSSTNLAAAGQSQNNLAAMQSATDFAGREAADEDYDSLRDKVQQELRSFLQAVKGMVVGKSYLCETQGLFTNISSHPSCFLNSAFDASLLLDRMCQPDALKVLQPVLSKLHGLLKLHIVDAEPQSAEARRRLTFFVNSLFMDTPKAPRMSDMLSWTVVTPYYSEDVLYSRKDLESGLTPTGGTSNVSTMLYLQTLFKSDWKNFMERHGLKDDSKVWTSKMLFETRLWASLRAQTLARTVEGMMYYEKALRLLGSLERPGEEKEVEELIKRKFGYVVACQVYGKQKKDQDHRAADIEMLLHRYPNLRVAYIDEERELAEKGILETHYYSVLIRAAPNGKGIEEIYRVRLPGNPVLGEGKPENQNHAIIFSRGEYIQAIDMNQDGYFEEALKMRSMLQEFTAPKAKGDLPTTILGFREHIFTAGVSSLANYMALQEFSFVTLGQRVLNKPLRMRLHYGHPDLFDKLFFMQRGGVSKASKGINLSEDIFAGYNNVLRGGAVEFKEYHQVGKGRDVGMQQIYKFEAKLSQGAAEQSLSRDVFRMSNRVDFFRLLSFYFGGIGHYISSMLTVTAIWVMVYLMLGLALFQHEKIGDRPIVPEGLLQLVLAGVGFLQTIPLLCTLIVERGIGPALWEVFQVFVSGGPIYFIFHIRTRDYYYTQTVLAGGAQYRPTGRGFVTQHSNFDENYRFFANSHFYVGFELLTALVLLAIYSDVAQFAGRTWSLWIAAVAFLFAPFWFNPMTFEWSNVQNGYKEWIRWMSTSGGLANNSWDTWWAEENKFYDSLEVLSKFYYVLRSVIYLVVAAGLMYKPLVQDQKYDALSAVIVTVGLVALLVFIYKGMDWSTDHCLGGNQYSLYVWIRSGKLIIGSVIIILLISLLISHPISVIFLLAVYYVLGFFVNVALVCRSKSIRALLWFHDIIIGHVIFVPLFFFASLQFPARIQTWLLYHNALSHGVLIEDIIKYTLQSKQETQGESKPSTPTPRESGVPVDSAATAARPFVGGAGHTAIDMEHPTRQGSSLNPSTSMTSFGNGSGPSTPLRGGRSISPTPPSGYIPGGDESKTQRSESSIGGMMSSLMRGDGERGSREDGGGGAGRVVGPTAEGANGTASATAEQFMFRQPTQFPSRH